MPMDKYSETLDWIYGLRGGEIDLRLDRMDRALGLFDHPEKKYPSFHIAGTNGKGSVSAILHRILCLSGYRTALYTSPHLVSFTERIRIGDQEIAPAEVIALAEEIRDRTARANIVLTFFEFATVMAFVHFARQGVDVGVIEVGLGGRLDATNLVQPVISVITTISKDHEAYLGSDIGSIAREKGGIIKPGVPVTCGNLPAEAVAVIKSLAQDRGIASYFLTSEYYFALNSDDLFDYKGLKQNFSNLTVALRGRHQMANAAVALSALELASGPFSVSERAIREGLRTVRWPGRFEVFGDGPVIVLDGAHNGEGAKALAEVLGDFRRGRKVKFLFASMQDKDWRLILDTLAKVADEFIFARVRMERSADPQQLAAYLSAKVPCRVIEESHAALRAIANGAQADDIVMIAGSLYLLGEIRPLAQEIARGGLGSASKPQ
jgi:dihydrofolate synthase / folylpolyglutamate synthase